MRAVAASGLAHDERLLLLVGFASDVQRPGRILGSPPLGAITTSLPSA